MQAFRDNNGFFLQQPQHVLDRIGEYLENRGIELTATDYKELTAILGGFPSHAERKGFRVVELHPYDVHIDGEILHTAFSRENPTLAWVEDRAEAVLVATRLARTQLQRPVMLLDAEDRLIQVIEEREHPHDYALYVTEGTIYDTQANVLEGIASITQRIDGGIPNLRSAYARFNYRRSWLSAEAKHKGHVLYITEGPYETLIVHRTVL